MKSFVKVLAVSATLIITLFSCETNEIQPGDKGSLTLEFDNRIGGTDLKLGETQATNGAGESFKITTLNYFISNIKLMDEAGNMISFPDKYYLVKESDAASQEIMLTDIPAADYHHIVYTIGVDSVKSISDVSQRTGVLDPASYGNDNMYWSWNMGYIFFKMEGISSAATTAGNVFQFHIGGFGGKDAPTPNNLKEVELHSHDMIAVRKGENPKAHIIMDVTKVFDGANQVKIAATPMIHNPKVGLSVSANYVDAFTVDHVHAH